MIRYVQPEHRKKGVGLSLLRLVSKVHFFVFIHLLQFLIILTFYFKAALAENCVRLNFAVLNWNQPSIDFYKSLGAHDLTQSEGWHCFRIHRQEIEKLANS